MKQVVLIIGIILLLVAPVMADEATLSIDFNDRSFNAPAYTQAGFESFIMDSAGSNTNLQTAPTIRHFGKITVILESLSETGYDDRLRNTVTNENAFSEAALLRDFVFAKGTNPSSGLQITVKGLSEEEEYKLSIWSYDRDSRGTRASKWSANGVFVTNHVFLGASLPLSDDDYRFDFKSIANTEGEIIIRGEWLPESVDEKNKSNVGVFLNALRIAPASKPESPKAKEGPK